MHSRWFLALLSLLLAVSTLACEEGEEAGADPNVEPIARLPGVYAPQGEKRIEEIIIMDEGLDPDRVSITAGAAAQVRVANRSDSPCTFFLGEYVIGLEVPPGETVPMGLTVPEDRTDITVPMGCQGDPDRQGSALIEF